MGNMVESVIAVMGLISGFMMAFSALLSGDVPRSRQHEESHHPRTIRLKEERMAA
ncbi:MAG: hypothetical protein NPIRA01_25650 [Nitrospirales bacterium]|nr:MAG: hypothetical protein NPIRA01_25650 [Nitrospirales bacterium]